MLPARSRRNRKITDWTLKLVNTKTIMVGILKTGGPVSSLECITSRAPPFLRGIHKPEFVEAANELASLGFGWVTVVGTSGQRPSIFLKKRPEEVEALFEADLVDYSFKDYKEQFLLPVSPSLRVKSRKELEERGMI